MWQGQGRQGGGRGGQGGGGHLGGDCGAPPLVRLDLHGQDGFVERGPEHAPS